MAEEFEECSTALKRATALLDVQYQQQGGSSSNDVRLKFCSGLYAEKKKDFNAAMECYNQCLNECTFCYPSSHTTLQVQHQSQVMRLQHDASLSIHMADGSNEDRLSTLDSSDFSHNSKSGSTGINSRFLKELRGEIMLRIAVLRKEMGLLDQALATCAQITLEPFSDSIKANTLCLKVRKVFVF